MKRKIICFILVGFACSMFFAAPSSHKCPLCWGQMRWTGETKTEWGKLVYEMECPSGHTSWEVDEWSSRSSSDDECQYDGYRLRFTGKTKSEWGKLLKEYECSAGHKYWATN